MKRYILPVLAVLLFGAAMSACDNNKDQNQGSGSTPTTPAGTTRPNSP